MTDAERWRTVAAWFEEAAETKFAGSVSHGASYGLCHALYVSGDPIFQYNALAEVLRDGGVVPGDYVGGTAINGAPGWRQAARLRATLALLMAHMAEDDGGNHKADA